MTQRRKPEEIGRLLKLYEERGKVTRRAFCESHGIAASTLGYYLRHHAKPAMRLARVDLQPAAAEARFVLVLQNGRRIECGEAELARLVRIAEAC
jgi:hypothetical protein